MFYFSPFLECRWNSETQEMWWIFFIIGDHIWPRYLMVRTFLSATSPIEMSDSFALICSETLKAIVSVFPVEIFNPNLENVLSQILRMCMSSLMSLHKRTISSAYRIILRHAAPLRPWILRCSRVEQCSGI